MFRHPEWLLAAGLLLAAVPAEARVWTDSTGKYKQRADLVNFDDQTVVLKKADGRLVAVPVDKLSKADRDYLNSKEAAQVMEKEASDDRAWTLEDGTTIEGKVLNYVKSDVVIESRDGSLLVDGKLLRQLTKFQQYLVPKIVNRNEEQPIRDIKDVQRLAAKAGMPLKYNCEGVLLELESGEKIAVPFFLFTAKDQKMLMPGWKNWLAAKDDNRKQQQHSFLLKSLANAYQQNKETQQIQMMQLLSDWFDLWQVGLQVNGQETSVTVPARNSEQAAELALRKYPGASVLYIQVLDRRRY